MLNGIRSPLDGIRSPFGSLRDSLARVIALLFSSNEPGFLFLADPLYCFTDTARTTNATVGQAVAGMTDLSGRGNHATQATIANRPILGRKPQGGRRNILRQTATLSTQTRVVTAAQHTLSFQGTGTVTLSDASTSGPLVGTGVSDIVSLTFTPTAGNLTLTVSGTVNDAQLELGAVRTAYQLVSDAGGFDVTEAGKPNRHYLFFGGSADPRWMQTPTITPGTDKAQVFAGVRKLSDAASTVLIETSVSATANPGTIRVSAPASSGAVKYYFESVGTVATTAITTSASFNAPHSGAISGLGDISGDLATLRINGTQVAQNLADQGTGNYLAYPAYIGARGGSSLFFNGEISALTARFGPNLDTAQIEQVERFTASKVAETTI
jgi:hypothetical protein